MEHSKHYSWCFCEHLHLNQRKQASLLSACMGTPLKTIWKKRWTFKLWGFSQKIVSELKQRLSGFPASLPTPQIVAIPSLFWISSGVSRTVSLVWFYSKPLSESIFSSSGCSPYKKRLEFWWVGGWGGNHVIDKRRGSFRRNDHHQFDLEFLDSRTVKNLVFSCLNYSSTSLYKTLIIKILSAILFPSPSIFNL